MNDKSNLINQLFKRAEEAPRHDYSLSEIGVLDVPEADKQQIVRHADETLAAAQEILDEAA